MNPKYKKIGKNISLFAISNFLPKIFSFILIPLYTRYLSTEDYGTVDLLITTVSLLIPILTVNIQDSILRFTIENDSNKKNVFSTGFYLLIIDLILLILFFIVKNIFSLNFITNRFLIFFIIYYICSLFYSFNVVFFKGLEKVNLVVIASLINSLCSLFLMFLLIIGLKIGVIGYMIALVSGYLLADLYYLIIGKVYRYISIHIDKLLIKKMVIYSFPMVFSSIGWWINNSSDRYILTFFSGVSIAGIYAVSSKIPSILKIFQSIFSQAWSISAIKDFDSLDSDGFFGNMYNILNLIMCVGCSILILFNIPLSHILYSGDFFTAWKYVPLLLLAVVFDCLTLFFGSMFFAVKDTKKISFATIIGAIVNTIFNFLFIPIFSAMGAAIATVFGYFITLLLSIIFIRKYISLKTNWAKNIFSYILLIIQTIFACFGNKYVIIQLVILILELYLYKGFIIVFLRKFMKKGDIYEKN